MVMRILVINPGSTSDELGIYEDGRQLVKKTLRYSPADLKDFDHQKITAQHEFRKKNVLDLLRENGIEVNSLSAVIGRGGLVKPIPGGTYAVNDALTKDLRDGVSGDHSSNLGGLIAREIAQDAGCPAFIADPVVVDELHALARYSGMPENPRISIFHALNHKRVARLAAGKLGKKYENCRLIVMHGGGGISVGAHVGGRVIDVNNALDGDGPFTPQRSGGVPSGGLARLCFSGRDGHADIKLKIKGRGGLVAYTGTSDLIALEKFIATGEKDPQITVSREKAHECVSAMAYQIAKEIGAMAVVLAGRVDAIVLTGGIVYDKHLMPELRARIDWLAPVIEFPGGDENRALMDAATRALEDPSSVQEYK
ncbi:MAG: butyrate kinase [Elusimicrobiaceae bacterium]|nr:butyrate kinase [Elusimicrobiaceae bacterium]